MLYQCDLISLLKIQEFRIILFLMLSEAQDHRVAFLTISQRALNHSIKGIASRQIPKYQYSYFS